MRPPARPRFARTPDVAMPGRAVQPAGAERVFTATARVLRAPPPPTAVAEELMPAPGGGFHVRSAQRQTLTPPTGTFNFVRIQGKTPRSQPILVSPKLPHAQLAAGRPVVYAGTAQFNRGEMAWWSNYSGTYQPIAAFHAQAGLPEDKFVPWQRLQMGGISMQRGTFVARRTADAPETPAQAARAEGAAGAPKNEASSPRKNSKPAAGGAAASRTGEAKV